MPSARHSCSTILVSSVASCAGSAGRPGWCRRCRSRRRGRARAARRRARRRPAACSASTRRAATSKPAVSKICEPMCECRPSSSSPGAACTRRTASSASPAVIEKPNFWSSWAVAMYSCVCASTPAVTRTITRAVRAELGGQRRPAGRSRGRSRRRSGRRRPRRRARSSAVDLLLPWKPIRAGAKPARRATASSPPEQTSRRSPSSATQRATVGAQERLAGVVDVVGRERLAEGAGAGPEVGLVEDVRRRAVLGGQVAHVDAADVEGAVVVLAGGRATTAAGPGR